MNIDDMQIMGALKGNAAMPASSPEKAPLDLDALVSMLDDRRLLLSYPAERFMRQLIEEARESRAENDELKADLKIANDECDASEQEICDWEDQSAKDREEIATLTARLAVLEKTKSAFSHDYDLVSAALQGCERRCEGLKSALSTASARVAVLECLINEALDPYHNFPASQEGLWQRRHADLAKKFASLGDNAALGGKP